MRVLVTGAAGRIGQRVAERVAIDHDVIGLDVRDGPRTTVVGTIADAPLVEDLCSRVDAVIHTAALHAPHVGLVPDRDFRETNVAGTRLLLRASLRGSVRRFVYTSTTSLYGEALVPRDRAVWVTEDLEPQPRDIYDETKIAAEQECAAATRAGLTCISLRMSRAFPEPDDVVAIHRLSRGVDPRDVAHGHARALVADLTGFQVFNISAASPFTEDETEELLSNAQAVVLRHYPWAADAFACRGWQLPSSIDRVYVTDRAQRMLGYRPEHNFAALFHARSM